MGEVVFEAVFSSIEATFDASFSTIETVFDAEFTNSGTKLPYDGPYEIMPSEEEQVLNTKDLVSLQNFKIKPIPSNYGRIVYDGSGLTII